ncbi:Pr6Pr family membrane protein [Streptomyces sp. SBT349]|uniref:Pr6Pr family membrane protein n=1 Tax=Streptomyces sp. SBT349 TaxID=1580539 RepID=UPI00066E363D|nr:Pr6Pr family membrane protein [Streptomyces sp. SBT349]
MTENWQSRVWRLVIAAAAIAGLAINTTAYPTAGDSLMSFTQQSNVMVALCFLWLAAWPAPRQERRQEAALFVRGAVTLYILITGIVYSLLLADGWDSYGLGDTLAHVLVPAAVLTDWVVTGTNGTRNGASSDPSNGPPRRTWYPLAWLAYLVCYVTTVLVRGSLTDRYPYYFLNPDSVGVDGLITHIAAFLVGFTVLGYAVLAAGRLKRIEDASIAYRT